jgi:hypothetical protein
MTTKQWLPIIAGVAGLSCAPVRVAQDGQIEPGRRHGIFQGRVPATSGDDISESLEESVSARIEHQASVRKGGRERLRNLAPASSEGAVVKVRCKPQDCRLAEIPVYPREEAAPATVPFARALNIRSSFRRRGRRPLR